MERSNIIRRIQMDCPLCDKVHEVEEKIRIARTIIKGEKVDYEEIYYFCPDSTEDESEFTTGKIENRNLLNARNKYRRAHGLLTSDEIVHIRQVYGLSQVELSKLLGWGEATISRYESKAIQDEAYDNILRIIRDNPLSALDFLQKNSHKFTNIRKNSIRQKIITNLDEEGREYLQRQALESEYVNYQEPCDANGFQLLNIEKLESIVSYYAEHVNNLYKVKLMKMLWYADSLNYKLNNISMTGLVYCHDNMGALPIGHYKIVGLENIKVQEEDNFEYTKYHFLPNNNLNDFCLTDDDKRVLDIVIEKFKHFSASEIVKYMHDEIAYKKTNDEDIIPYSLAGKIREL